MSNDAMRPTEFYRPEIDGLRAIAVLSVVASHFDDTLLPSGYLGVDIFFVISGYVITAALQRQYQRSLLDYLAAFYIRRAKRLLPALILCVVVTAFLGCLVVAPREVASSLRAGVYALFGVSNFYFYTQTIDYFGASAELNLFTHTWSLGVEEQFYLLFPTLCWLFAYGGSRAGWRLAATVAALTAMSLAAYALLIGLAPHATYYLMPFRFWELGVGCLTFFCLARVHSLGDTVRGLVLWSAFAGLVGTLFAPIELQLLATVAAVICTSAMLSVLAPGQAIYRLLTSRVFVTIGLISYSLYLWHWSVLALSRWTVGVFWWTAPFQLALMFACAGLSYVYVERPLRHSQWSMDRWRTAAWALGGIALSVVLIVVVSKVRHSLFTGKEATLVVKGVESLAADKWHGSTMIWTPRRCILGSDDDVGKSIEFERCAIAPRNAADRRFLVIGNSFSAAQFEMYLGLTDAGLGQVIVTSSWGASPIPELPNTSSWAKANRYYWSTVVPSLLDKLRPGDFVLMINDIAQLAPQVSTVESDARLKTLGSGLMRFARDMDRRGLSIIFQSANPFLRETTCTPDMAQRQWFHLTGVTYCNFYSRERSLQRREALHQVLVEVQKSSRNFFVLDLYPLLCPDEVCTYDDKNGMLLYRDMRSHMSVEANYLAQNLLRTLVQHAIGRRADP